MSFETRDIRNIVLLGHQSAGKTTLGQGILYVTGSTSRLERVDEGNSSLDFDSDEIERKMSLVASVGWGEWKKKKINFIDTPGYDDFRGEVVSALRAVEGAILLVRADGGVEGGTEKSWEVLNDQGMPRIIFINRMDKEHADYSETLGQIREQLLGSSVVPFQVPFGSGPAYTGYVDLVHMKAYEFDADNTPKETTIPEGIADEVEELRSVLVEGAAEASEELMEKFFEEGTLSDEEVVEGLSKGIREATLSPVLVGDAYNGRGVRMLMDEVIELLPSPEQRPLEFDGETIAADASGKPLALVFKNINEMNLGDLYFLRVFSGTLEHGKDYHNLSADTGERVGQVYQLTGKNRSEIPSLVAGDIGATVKLKNTKVGDTLGRKGEKPLPEFQFPQPMNEMAIFASSKGDEEKLGTGLNRLAHEDPSFSFRFDPDVKQSILSVQGDTQMDVILHRLKRKFNVGVETEKPRIPYRETISKPVDTHYRHKKQTGGRGQFGEVYVKYEPLTRGDGFEFLNEITGGVIPGKFIPAVEKGIREAMEAGANSGFVVVDVRARLHFGSFHNVDSDEHSFKLAGANSLKEGVKQAAPILLEPIYDLEITVPDENLGDIMGDISGRRGRIVGTDQCGKYQIVKASAPLAELHKYGTQLRSITGGRASFSWNFSHYDPVPHDQMEKILAEAASSDD
ncbi:MAG: elongation factor G [Candidatus Krumholzibacteria bacterium]|jgi:elongation factor G|nr:elongation factor G [Candidatus Krumholzibacteria bacterium]MDP6669651.1 elongation factor G [Candidatus Krumholzibacteria bacterium]MDP6796312.1 elongation factor G [Candidatus Krumholzibacteria bacterium]MDP7021077.1 elongation factor G [Candidatus Krumholzibacteria bacterium]